MFGANVQRGARDFEGDTERTKARKDAGVEALLFEDYPIRHWDHYLGPRLRRLYAATVPEGEERIEGSRDLDEDVTGFTFDESDADISPDGSFVVAVKRVFHSFPETLDDLVRYDTATGERRPLTHGDAAYGMPMISPDGKSIAAIRFTYATPAEAERMTLVLLDADTGAQRTLAAATDRRPDHLVWGADASTLFFTADDEGLHSAYRVDLPDGTVTRLTAAGAVSDLCPTPDGATIYALQSTMASPPRIVRFDARTPDQAPTRSSTASTSAGSRRTASSSGCPRPPRTAPRSAPGSCGRRARPRTRPPRSSSSSTAARSAPGTRGTGAGTRTSSSSAATRS